MSGENVSRERILGRRLPLTNGKRFDLQIHGIAQIGIKKMARINGERDVLI
jgi:hypothetical protein